MRFIVLIGVCKGVFGTSSSTDPLMAMGELVSSNSSIDLNAWLDMQETEVSAPGSWRGDHKPLPVLSNAWTEELVFLSHLRRDGPLSPIDILRRIKILIPSSSWTEEKVEARINVFRATVVVPEGLHRALDGIYLGGDSFITREKRYQESLRPYLTHRITGIAFSHRSILDAWTTHCIEKYHKWTVGLFEYEPCRPVSSKTVTRWTLSPAGILVYLAELERREIERINGQPVFPVRVAVVTPPTVPVVESRKRKKSSHRCMSTSNELKCLVLEALMKNASYSEMFLFVKSHLPDVSEAGISREKTNIMEYTTIPSVVHSGLRSAEMLPCNDHMQVWQKYCIDPLILRKGYPPYPCYGAGRDWKLSRPTIELYMKDLLDSLF